MSHKPLLIDSFAALMTVGKFLRDTHSYNYGCDDDKYALREIVGDFVHLSHWSHDDSVLEWTARVLNTEYEYVPDNKGYSVHDLVHTLRNEFATDEHLCGFIVDLAKVINGTA